LGASLLVTFALIAIVFIDLDVMIIPDNLSLNGIVVGILYSTVLPSLHGVQGDLGIFMTHWLGFKSSLYGMLCGGGVIFLIERPATMPSTMAVRHSP
jgi:prepilin signal peptidase PulO-like enzyme (type II secretory pathway)